ncbi:MAG TPA: OB-fold nucleic acid binding domain-containing protein, partial [Candidatus Paceibacterota bacterium]|nr:OB-fold nucleic acid binding domain-containing protein [Candidatus Paceibacterota bacterium]
LASMPGRVVVQWDKDDCEDLGIIKVDFLGLGMMSVLQDTVELARRLGRDVDLAQLPENDKETFVMMQTADTIGVFQIESRAQMSTLPRMKPENFYDVVVEVAIIRPGPIQGHLMHPYLTRRKQVKEQGADPDGFPCYHPDLKEVLKRTYGVPLFQEQMLKMAMVMADFSGAEAEELRRALSFHRSQERMQKVEKKLRAAMERKGVSAETIEEIVKAVGSFALYGFPESHAISFAHLAYASAYLKAHRGPEFYASLLNNQPMGFYSTASLVKDGQRHGVKFLPVCVMRSEWDCAIVPVREASVGKTSNNEHRTADSEVLAGSKALVLNATLTPAVSHRMEEGRVRRGDALLEPEHSREAPESTPSSALPIRLGFRILHGLSKAGAEALMLERRKAAFTSLDDCKRRVPLSREEWRVLAEAGALNCFVAHRRDALWNVEKTLRQGDLFEDLAAGATLTPALSHSMGEGEADSASGVGSSRKVDQLDTASPLSPMDYSERIRADYSTMRLTTGKHPMALIRSRLKDVWRAGDLPEVPHGSRIRIAGNVICRQRPGTAKGFVFISLEDETGVSNAIVTPPMFEANRLLITEESFLVIEGVLQKVDNVIHVKAERIERLQYDSSVSSPSYDFH